MALAEHLPQQVAGLADQGVAAAVAQFLVDPPQAVQVQTGHAHGDLLPLYPGQRVVIRRPVLGLGQRVQIEPLFQPLDRQALPRLIGGDLRHLRQKPGHFKVGPGIFHHQKAGQSLCFKIHDRHTDHAGDALRPQELVLRPPGGIVPQLVHIFDHKAVLAELLERVHPHRQQLQGDALQVLDMGHDALPAHLIKVADRMLVPEKLVNGDPVRVVIGQQDPQHLIGGQIRVRGVGQPLVALHQRPRRGQIALGAALQLGRVAVHVDGQLHAAQPPVIGDQAVVAQNVAHRRIPPHTGAAMGRLVFQLLVGAEVAGRGPPRQILIAPYALGRLAEVHPTVAVDEQQLIGVNVAEINQLVDPIQRFLKIHIPTSSAAKGRFCLVR